MTTRLHISGDRRPSNYQDEAGFRERSQDALIRSVDERTGLARVALVGGGGAERFVQVAALSGLSASPPYDKAAWRRFMPGSGAVVTVDHTPSGELRARSFHGYGEVAGLTPARGERADGYAVLAREAEKPDSPLVSFRELKEGEWHDRSGGGAEVFGGADGELALGTGMVSVRLLREGNEGQGAVEVSSRRVRIRESAVRGGVQVTAGVDGGTGGSLGRDVDGQARRRSFQVQVSALNGSPVGGPAAELGLGDLGTVRVRLAAGRARMEIDASERVTVQGAEVRLANIAGVTTDSVVLAQRLVDWFLSTISVATPFGPSGTVIPSALTTVPWKGEVKCH